MTADTAASSKRTAPGPLDDAGFRFLPGRMRSQLFVLPRVVRNPPEYFVQVAHQYGGVVTLSPGRIFLITHPDAVKHVVQDNHTNYIKGPWYKVLKPLMGDGLFSSDGELWKRQRRLVQPAFQKKHNPAIAGIVAEATRNMLDRWEANASRGQALDARGEVILLTLEILLRSMFSGDLIGYEKELREAVIEYEQHMDLVSAVNPVKLPAWFPNRGQRRFLGAVHTLEQFIFRVVEERRRTKTDNGDLVSLLLWARDEETGESMSDRQIRDELMTMLQAGHDTVSDAIAWTWYLMSKNPEAQQRVEQEIDSVLGDRPPHFENLAALDYTTRVILESMRIYPPGWVFARTPLADDVIAGYHIPAKSLVVISPYVTHRLPDIWANPETFDADRFLPERIRERPRFAYYPFSAGPRQCVGAGLAMLEAQMIISMAAQKYRVTAPPGFAPGLKPRISLTSDRTIWLTPSLRGSRSAESVSS